MARRRVVRRDPAPVGCTRLNRAGVRTIYPPVAPAWCTAVYTLGGVDARHKPWQVAGLATDTALVAPPPFVLRAWGRDERVGGPVRPVARPGARGGQTATPTASPPLWPWRH